MICLFGPIGQNLASLWMIKTPFYSMCMCARACVCVLWENKCVLDLWVISFYLSSSLNLAANVEGQECVQAFPAAAFDAKEEKSGAKSGGLETGGFFVQKALKFLQK